MPATNAMTVTSQAIRKLSWSLHGQFSRPFLRLHAWSTPTERSVSWLAEEHAHIAVLRYPAASKTTRKPLHFVTRGHSGRNQRMTPAYNEAISQRRCFSMELRS